MATETPRTRRLDARDAMILAAATVAAVALAYVLGPVDPSEAGSVLEVEIFEYGNLSPPAPAPEAPTGPGALRRAIEGATRPVLTAWTLATMVVGLRRPRPPWRRLFRRPGMVACAVATPVLLALFVGIGLETAVARFQQGGAAPMLPTAPSGPPAGPTVGPVPVLPSPMQATGSSLRKAFARADHAGQVVAGAWLIMALGGWWRPERSGIDRLGRVVGTGWIALALLGFVHGLWWMALLD